MIAHSRNHAAETRVDRNAFSTVHHFEQVVSAVIRRRADGKVHLSTRRQRNLQDKITKYKIFLRNARSFREIQDEIPTCKTP